MASKRKRGRTQKKGVTNGGAETKNEREEDGGGVPESGGYEQFRDQRIKENKERMEKLGILEISRKLKSEILPPKRPTKRNPKPAALPPPPTASPRRSSRLKSVTPISYSEKRSPKKAEKIVKNVKICIKEGSKPEIYTEEHLKLLGDCKETWTLYEDGYDKDGERIYDPYQGKSCHQCRQKTLGYRTDCSKCNTVQGQFCGDCLYMRYGENVKEANKNPGWICPVCRGICNCSRCRRSNGWEPTGAIYRKVLRHGFRSVAHYLIQTRLSLNREEPAGEDPLSASRLLSLADREAELSDGISMPPLDDYKDEMEEENKGDDSDGAYNSDDEDHDHDNDSDAVDDDDELDEEDD